MKAAKRNQFGLAALLIVVAVLSAVFAFMSAVPLLADAAVSALLLLSIYAAPTMLVDYFARRGDSPERRD